MFTHIGGHLHPDVSQRRPQSMCEWGRYRMYTSVDAALNLIRAGRMWEFWLNGRYAAVGGGQGGYMGFRLFDVCAPCRNGGTNEGL